MPKRMTETELVEAEKRNMLKRLRAHGLPLKRKRAEVPASPCAKALREAGVSEADIVTLIEGHRHAVEAARTWGDVVRVPVTAPRGTLSPALDAALVTLQEAPHEIPDKKTEDREALLRRIVYGESATLPAGTHEKVARLLTGRRSEPTPTPAPSGENLHERLRRAVTR